jgi:hypothetical protein
LRTNHGSRSWEGAALAGALVLALAVRVPLLFWGLPGIFEEAIPFWRAWDLWGWGPFRHFDLNPHFFKYPSLVIYLQFLGQACRFGLLRVTGAIHSAVEYYALYLMDPSPFFVTARAITTALGVLTLLPAWALARRVAGVRAAVITVLLLAIQPTLIAKSQVVEVDIPLTFFITWGLWLAVDLRQNPTARSAALMGLAAGLAASSKYTGLILVAPALLAIWRSHPAGEAPRRPTPARASSKRPRRPGPARAHPEPAARRPAPRARRLVLAVSFAGSLTAALLLTSPYLALDFRSVLVDLRAEGQHMALGHFGLAGGPAGLAYARDWFVSVMGWPLGIASLAGLALGAARRQPWALILAAFFLPYALIVGSWQMMADRYVVPLIPIGMVTATALLDAALAATPALRTRWRAALAATAGVALMAGPLVAMLPARFATLRPDTRTLAKRWIEGNLPPGSMLVCEEYGPDLFEPLDFAKVEREVAAELKRRGYHPRLYALQTLPLFQVVPERSARFYSTERYTIADAVVVTSSVRDRYRAAPARFAPQLAFYDSLETRWPRLAEFQPRGGPGPEIVIYRNPRTLRPFAARGDPGPLDSTLAVAGEATGAEGAHYLQLALDYEFFGFIRHAQESYLLALRFGRTEPKSYVLAGTWLARCLWRQGRRQEAVNLLRTVEAAAPGPREAAQLAGVRAALLAGDTAASPSPGSAVRPRPEP